MGNETSAQEIDNGVDVEIDVDKEISNKPVFSKEALQALREKKVANAKALKKVDKKLEKTQAEADKFSDENVDQLVKDAEVEAQAEFEALTMEVDGMDAELEIKEGTIDKLQVSTAKAIQTLEQVQGISGLHRNSPKKKANTPWKYAIPISLIGTLKAEYPGQFHPVFKAGSDRPFMYKNKSGHIRIDFSDHVTCHFLKGHGGRQLDIPHDYGQGITKWFKDVLTKHMPKVA